MFYKIAVVITFCFCTAHAQTQSDCRTSFSPGPNVKPGVSGAFTLTRDGKTLLVPGADGKIRFIDMASGSIKRTLSGHTNYVYMANFSADGNSSLPPVAITPRESGTLTAVRHYTRSAAFAAR